VKGKMFKRMDGFWGSLHFQQLLRGPHTALRARSVCAVFVRSLLRGKEVTSKKRNRSACSETSQHDRQKKKL
jgi:hypothetical protein